MQFNARELLSIVPLFTNSPPEVFTAFAKELQSETLAPETLVFKEARRRRRRRCGAVAVASARPAVESHSRWCELALVALAVVS